MADKMGMSAIVLAALVAIAAGQQMDTTVCMGQTPTSGQPAFPKLPKSFDCHLEADISNRNFTTDYHIWFDQPNNRLALYQVSAGVRTQIIYNFTSMQYISVDQDTKYCRVTPLNAQSNVPLYFLFATAGGKMATTNQLFHVNDGQLRYKYINQTFVRGVNCDMWRACLYIQSMNSTMNVDWYFSASTWQTSSLNPQVPVRAHVYGKTNGRKFDHTYEFSDFHLNFTGGGRNPYITTAGAYCLGEKSSVPLPTPASAFHFTAEIVSPTINAVNFIKEYYDDDLKLVRYDYFAPDPTKYGTNLLNEVHDFTTGVAYITDKIRGNCSIAPIENTGFDVRNADPVHVRIRSSREFFYFDKSAYVYEGQRQVRGINADVWIAQRNDWPRPNAGFNSTWEWYFATKKYSENLQDQLQFQDPIMLYMSGGEGQQYYYNIYGYDEQRPMIWTYDISKCFNYTQRRDFSFQLPGSYTNLAQGNLETFRYALLRAITKAGTVNNLALSALRVYNIQLDYSDSAAITVTFTLLDKAPAVGDVTRPNRENDLNTVASAISKTISNGQFKIMMRGTNSQQSTTMIAKPNSMVQTQRIVKRSYYRQTVQGSVTSTGTSGGAMAGMAVALLVVFFIMGVLATYFYYRRQGGAFGPKKFGNEDITDSQT